MNKLKFASIIVTYRCNAKCSMCNTWKYPSITKDEVSIDIYKKLPFISTINITGGEPFIRDDLAEIISILRRKAKRLVISTNGYYTDRIIKLFESRKDIGIRISIEGLPKTNDNLRGIKDGFDNGIKTLIGLYHLGIKDIGFGITISDKNAKDMIYLYRLARMMNIEFATAAIHNSFYFHKYDNRFEYPEVAIEELEKLVNELLCSKKIKDWFRAYFNFGLINYIKGNPRLLPCEMGHDSFFLDPYGEILPCNVMNESMGNLTKSSFEDIWNSGEAHKIREMVRKCNKNCWMMGSVGQQMLKYKYISKVLKWIIINKVLKKHYNKHK